MSQRTLRIVLIVLTALGLVLASYLTYVHYANLRPVCTSGGSCFKVQTSTYSKLAGVPVALMGLLGYIAIMVSLLLPESENPRLRRSCDDRRLRLLGLSDLPRAVLDPCRLRGVRDKRGTDDDHDAASDMAFLARRGPEEYDSQNAHPQAKAPQTAQVSAS